MSHSGDIKARGAAPGPYGPNNPPPPPPGSPPRKADNKRGRVSAAHPMPSPQKSLQIPASVAEKPWRKLNQRQRKERKMQERKMQEREDELQAKSAQGRGRSRSRSPIREDDRSIRVRSRDEPAVRRERDEYRPSRSSFGGSQDRRQPLKEARQYTPDQIMDETYGRLSPGTGGNNHYQEALGDMHRRPVARNEWPEEQSWSPRCPSVGEHSGQTQQGHAGWDEYSVPSFEQIKPSQGGQAVACLSIRQC